MANARLSIPLLFSSLLAAALAVGAGGSLAGCGGGGSSSTGGEGGAGGEGSTGTGTGTGTCGLGADGCFDYSCFKGDAPAVSFKADVLPIFRTSCGLSASCHGNESGPGGQHYLGPKNSDPEPTTAQIAMIFEQSVGKMPDLDAGMNLITPSDPEHSFLMYKLDGITCAKLACAAGKKCGSLMPEGSTEPMPAAKRDIIRRWIAQGAKND
jgi:hypothetical protein